MLTGALMSKRDKRRSIAPKADIPFDCAACRVRMEMQWEKQQEWNRRIEESVLSRWDIVVVVIAILGAVVGLAALIKLC